MTLLLEEVLEVALLLLGLALPLVGATLSLRALVTREGTAGFLHAALGPIHCPFVLVVPAAPARHGFFLLRKLVGQFTYPEDSEDKHAGFAKAGSCI
jgi:hypothetical protein